MKVIYKETIVQKILRAHKEAMKEQREIEKIVVTFEEGVQLERSLGNSFYPGFSPLAQWLEVEGWHRRHGHRNEEPCPEVRVFGVQIEVEHKP